MLPRFSCWVGPRARSVSPPFPQGETEDLLGDREGVHGAAHRHTRERAAAREEVRPQGHAGDVPPQRQEQQQRGERPRRPVPEDDCGARVEHGLNSAGWVSSRAKNAKNTRRPRLRVTINVAANASSSPSALICTKSASV
jgi:hypothetical protein